jgi:hypothetical protein
MSLVSKVFFEPHLMGYQHLIVSWQTWGLRAEKGSRNFGNEQWLIMVN